ncbi:MAG: helix-turn-helix domain-containing protein [Sphingomonadaceae bacterium]|nr:helix-turn-helix domain-containing protein [Sphingomonadaceae bacterium]
MQQKVKVIRALERGVDVLFEIRRSRAVSLHDLHLRLGLPKATLLRILVTLAKKGLVWQRIADGAWLASHTLTESVARDISETLAEIASAPMAALSARVNWPSVLAAPRLDHVEIIETNSPLLRLDSAILGPVGVALSYIHTATGRAYLSACGDRERDAIIARLRPPNATDGEEQALRAMLADFRARGYSLRDPLFSWPDRNKQAVVRDGRRSMAVAIRVHGEAVAALNITWPSRRVETETVVRRHYQALRDTAEGIGGAYERLAVR